MSDFQTIVVHDKDGKVRWINKGPRGHTLFSQRAHPDLSALDISDHPERDRVSGRTHIVQDGQLVSRAEDAPDVRLLLQNARFRQRTLLAQLAWMVHPDTPYTDDGDRAAWEAYRQQLIHLLDGTPDLNNLVWPVEPFHR